jgi:hypothetical protein
LLKRTEYIELNYLDFHIWSKTGFVFARGITVRFIEKSNQKPPCNTGGGQAGLYTQVRVKNIVRRYPK